MPSASALGACSLERRAELEPSVCQQRRAADHDRVALDHCLHAETGAVAEALGGRELSEPLARVGGDRLRDRMLARALGGAGQPEQLLLARPRPATTSTTRMRPSVTVPVLSSTIAVIRRVCSSTSGPLISTPSCAPRPVPTMSAVGVARPSAHGQAMISTATAAVNASAASPVTTSQPASVSRAMPITTGTKTADTRSTRRWIGALPGLRLGHEPRDLRERGVRADARGAHDAASRTC